MCDDDNEQRKILGIFRFSFNPQSDISGQYFVEFLRNFHEHKYYEMIPFVCFFLFLFYDNQFIINL